MRREIANNIHQHLQKTGYWHGTPELLMELENMGELGLMHIETFLLLCKDCPETDMWLQMIRKMEHVASRKGEQK